MTNPWLRRNKKLLFLIVTALLMVLFYIPTKIGGVPAARADDEERAIETNKPQVPGAPATVSGEIGNVGPGATASDDPRVNPKFDPDLLTEGFDCHWLDPLCAVLEGANWVLYGLGWVLSRLSGGFFVLAIDYNKVDFIASIPAVHVGWSIARDTSNLFFIIILIIVAIYTIFDLPGFNAKETVPKLILIALLINFSFTIGAFVIKQANMLGNVFYSRIAPPGETVGSMLDKAVNYEITEKEVRGILYQTKGGKDIRKVLAEHKSQSNVGPVGAAECLGSDGKLLITPNKLPNGVLVTSDYCRQWRDEIVSQAANTGSKYQRLAISIIAKALIYPIAAFVLIAGGIMLLGRVVALMFLLILAPLAFLSYLLPAKMNRWGDWWGKLFSHAFFFPAFMFCLMISLLVMNEISKTRGPASGILISYGLGVALLIGSLIVAKQMGAIGAGATIGIGNKMRGWAQAKAKNAGWRAGGLVAKTTLGGLQETGLLDTRLGRFAAAPLTRGMEYAASRRKKLADEREKARVERVRGAAGAVSPEYAAGILRRTSFSAATSQSDFEEFVDKAKPGELAKVMEGFSAKQIRERAQKIKDPKKQEKIYSSIGDLNKRTLSQTDVADRLGPNYDLNNLNPEQQEHMAKATATVISGMSTEDMKKISSEALNLPHVQMAIKTALGSNAQVMKNIGNTETKARQIQGMLKEAAGMPDNIDLTAPLDLSVTSLTGDVIIDNDTIRQTFDRIRGDISMTPAEQENAFKDYIRGWFDDAIRTGAIVPPELDQHRGRPSYPRALENYLNLRSAETFAAANTRATNMDLLVRNLRRSPNPGHRATATMLDSQPALRVNIAHGIPFSDRLGAGLATAAQAEAEGAPPPAPPPPRL